MKERVAWFDFLRGVAILMVVAIHTFASTLQKEELVGDVLILFRQVLNCSVPLFLAISGFFLAKKREERSYIRFWKHQIPKVYVPTLIWSLPYLALHIWQGNDWAEGIVIFLLCGFSVYYFIALIIQYYLLLPMLVKVKLGGVIITFFITILAIGLVSYLDLIEGYNMSTLVRGGPFPVWLVFFTIGIYLGNMKERTYRLWPWFLVLVIGLFLSFLETRWLYPIHHIGYGIKPSTHVYSLAVIIVLFSDKIQKMFTFDSFLFSVFVRLGRISFGVYLIHCFFIMAFSRLPFHLGWLSHTFVVLALSWCLIYVVQRAMPSVARRVGF